MAAAPDVVEKWGEAVAERGFAQVPNYLLLLNNFADEEERLSPAELMILIQLVGAWWKKEEMPFPSIKTLSVRTGASQRQVHRAIKALEAKNLLSITKRRTKGIIASNAYDLSPLVETLQEVARVYPSLHKRSLSAE